MAVRPIPFVVVVVVVSPVPLLFSAVVRDPYPQKYKSAGLKKKKIDESKKETTGTG